ncbi:hypothetical protein [Mesorhizobium sp.]|uniref:hypothetical protein n=1 Tax=Mesorhizobium sp. TaxID=1871066 RepID=UPI0025C44FCC|nr:hypothetical protein [Mesorhizobium sp.]
MSIQDELQSFCRAYAAAYSAGGALRAMFTVDAELHHPLHLPLLAVTQLNLSTQPGRMATVKRPRRK